MLLLRAEVGNIRHPPQHFVQQEIAGRQLHLSRLDFRHVEDVVDYAQQVSRRIVHLAKAVFDPRHIITFQGQVGHPDDGIHGCAYLVAHVGQEIGLGFGAHLGLVPGSPQFVLGSFYFSHRRLFFAHIPRVTGQTVTILPLHPHHGGHHRQKAAVLVQVHELKHFPARFEGLFQHAAQFLVTACSIRLELGRDIVKVIEVFLFVRQTVHPHGLLVAVDDLKIFTKEGTSHGEAFEHGLGTLVRVAHLFLDFIPAQYAADGVAHHFHEIQVTRVGFPRHGGHFKTQDTPQPATHPYRYRHKGSKIDACIKIRVRFLGGVFASGVIQMFFLKSLPHHVHTQRLRQHILRRCVGPRLAPCMLKAHDVLVLVYFSQQDTVRAKELTGHFERILNQHRGVIGGDKAL